MLLASCAGSPEPTASVSTTTTCPTPATAESGSCAPATTTAVAAEGPEFCAAGEEFIRNYEDADYARSFDPSELRAFMERGDVLTDTMAAEAPTEVGLSFKAVAAAFDKRRSLYSSRSFEIGAVTPEENAVLAAVEVDVEDSEQRVHDYLVTRCNLSL